MPDESYDTCILVSSEQGGRVVTMFKKISLMAVLLSLILTVSFAESVNVDKKEKQKISKGSRCGVRYGSFSIPVEDGFSLQSEAMTQIDTKQPSVILMHEEKKKAGMFSWNSDFRRKLFQSGMNIFSYDARGHGLNVKGTPLIKNNKIVGYVNDYKVTWESFSSEGENNHWNKMTGDLETFMKVFDKNDYHKPGEYMIIGAGIGADIALKYAAEDKSIKGLILLSPHLEKFGVETLSAAKKWDGRPCLLIYSFGDEESRKSCEKLYEIMSSNAGDKKDNIELEIPQGSAYGMAMIDENLTEVILGWIKNNVFKE